MSTRYMWTGATDFITIRAWSETNLNAFDAPLVAFTTFGDPAAWIQSTWISPSQLDTDTNKYYRDHQILVGPDNGGTALTPGTWRVWQQLAQAPVRPGQIVGTLQMFGGAPGPTQPTSPGQSAWWDEIQSVQGTLTDIQLQLATLQPASLAAVALSGQWSDILNVPSFAPVAFSGRYSDLIGAPPIAPGNTGTITITDNTNGTATIAATGTSTATDNGNGTATVAA